ncbi:hypothetical protein KAR28_01150 [Candidatus Parcubacteria bacterium]|nr:hypothetical protein [Candidatus Parcubacteria bacterium]
MKDNFQQLGDIFNAKKTAKAPAYQWQDLALRVIKELRVPNFKRSAVFKVCKENSKPVIEQALNDTKELCKTGNKWQYFFKVISVL